MASSSLAEFKIGVQAAKGVAAADYICGQMFQSRLVNVYDTEDARVEHFCSPGTQRPTAVKSLTNRTSYNVEGGGSSAMYSGLVGAVLRGAGFINASTTVTGTESHVFTITSEAAWLSCISGVPQEGVGNYQRKSTDTRVETVEFTFDDSGGTYTFDVNGLTMGDALGTETTNNETPTKILQNRGSITFNINGVDYSTIDLTSFAFQIENPLDAGRFRLFNFGKNTLPQSGMGISATLGGVFPTEAIIKEIDNGATAGLTVSESPATATMTAQFQSRVNIGGTAIPFSIEFVLGRAQIQVIDYEHNEDDQVEADIEVEMVDDGTVTEPCTITIVNDFAGALYTGS